MISEHLFSRLDEIFLRLDEIAQEPGHSPVWYPGEPSETIETFTPSGRHAAEMATADTVATIDNPLIDQGSETMQQSDTEILFFDRHPRPQRWNDPDYRELDDDASAEEQELVEVAVLGEN